MAEWINAQDINDWRAIDKAFEGSALTSPSDGGDWLVYFVGARP